MSENGTRTVTIPVTFTIGTLAELGPTPGEQLEWVRAEQRGQRLLLSCGAGTGKNPYLEASLTVTGGVLYARTDVRCLAGDLWTELWFAARTYQPQCTICGTPLDRTDLNGRTDEYVHLHDGHEDHVPRLPDGG